MTETARDVEKICHALKEIQGLLRAYRDGYQNSEWLFPHYWLDVPAYVQRRLTEIEPETVEAMASKDPKIAAEAAEQLIRDDTIAQVDRAIESYEKRLRAPPPPTEGEQDYEKSL